MYPSNTPPLALPEPQLKYASASEIDVCAFLGCTEHDWIGNLSKCWSCAKPFCADHLKLTDDGLSCAKCAAEAKENN